MEIIGREISFGVAKEAARGTAEASADKWLRKVSANVVERADHAEDDTTRGRLEDGEGRRVVQKYIEGDVEGITHADAIGHFLNNLYGTVSTTVVEAGSVFSHEFTLQQDIQHPSLTLFAKDGDVQQYKFSNGMVGSYELSVATDDFVRFSSSFVAKDAAADSTSPSYDTEYDFISRDVTVKVADTEAGLPGATATKAKNVTITWDQGLIRDHVVGSYDPDDVYNGRMMIEGDMELNFTDETFKDLYQGDDAKYMSITITGAADLGAGNNPEIEIVLNKAQINDWNREGGANELVTESVSFRGYFNSTDNEQSKVTVQNATASY